MRHLLLLSLASALMAYGCGSDDPASPTDAPGSLGEACYPNDTCDAELMCVNGICVPADPADEDAGTTDVISPEDATGPDTTQDTQTGEDTVEDLSLIHISEPTRPY